MTVTAKCALLFVVFIDLLGQGLVFPIINALIMEPSSSFLPHDATNATRHLSYGVVIGIFFLCWFLGAPYISKLSDVIGRKNAILICLAGALVGYVITIAALYSNSLVLLVIGRGITGFTAGNQPIAQAAMIDASANAADRTRNLGYITAGVAFGLVGGPLIGGFLSDPNIVGDIASLQAPFYATIALVLISIVTVLVFFHDVARARLPFVFRPREVVELLWRATRYPVVMRLSALFLVFEVANMTFYIFVDNYMTSRFGYGTLGSSLIMLTIGVALALSSTFLVAPVKARFGVRSILISNFLIWVVCGAGLIASPVAILCFVPVFAFYFSLGISYPTIMALYSASVSDADQGWVMGITTAVFTLAAGTMSLIGGELMSVDIRTPFYVVIGASVAGLGVLALFQRETGFARILRS